MPAPVSKPKQAPPPPPHDPHYDITEAVRDTVTVRGASDRNRVARSHTTQSVLLLFTSPLLTPPHRSIPPPTKPAQQPRSHSQDSAGKSKPKSKPKKGSQHADVIDRLDFTGVGPMFHHDGPFDACAPSRNRQPNKAPMFAWTPRSDDLLGSSGGSAYPSADAYKAFSNTNYVDPPKKKVDAIAEAWGIHEPEPYEEFFAGGGSGRADGDTPTSSIYNGRDAHKKRSTTTTAPPEPPRSNKRTVPPPQPIFVPDNPDQVDPLSSSPPLSPGGNFQRKKSLMHRIRKMRDAPNVPVSSDYDQPPSPSSTSDTTRPTHRSQNSFLGRFAGSRGAQPGSDKSEPFVYIDPTNSKELPPPPATSESPPDRSTAPYFDSPNGSTASPAAIGRKSSIMKKVGRVVGRNRQ
ncbi:hypothetical protein H0H87_002244 [Tephrocybe sp. NHM501043]|nr:hypothetical protein H0H87_002244 [Tephrocybe sp. NHM501043]